MKMSLTFFAPTLSAFMVCAQALTTCGCDMYYPAPPPSGSFPSSKSDNPHAVLVFTDEDQDGVANNLDCNDHDPSVHPGAFEYCDHKDNDCNGQTDEIWTSPDGAHEFDPCTVVNEYGCELMGVWNCAANGLGLVCNPPNRLPMLFEICNGIDDDCNGQTDETWPELGQTCKVTFGICVRYGLWVCDSYTGEDHCSGEDDFPDDDSCMPSSR